MGFWTRLWHRLLFGSSPLTTTPRPAARPAPACPAHPGSSRPDAARLRAAAAEAEEIAATIREWVKPQPPRCVYRTRQEVELALLLTWLPDAERRRFLDHLVPKAGRQRPWSDSFIKPTLWQQIRQWQPLVLPSPETMTSEGFCGHLKAELGYELITCATPLEMLSRPIRMLWLLRLGQRAGQAYAALEQALGSSALALDYLWWTIAEL